MKILVVTFPGQGLIHPHLAKWLVAEAGLVYRDALYGDRAEFPVEIDFRTVQSTSLAQARNQAVEGAMRMGADVLVQVDADQGPTVGTLRSLAIMYHSRAKRLRDNFIVTCPTRTALGRVPIWIDLDREVTWGEAKEKSAVGKVARGCGGFIAADLGVFRRIPQPWFKEEYADRSEIFRERGQDIRFYDIAREIGIETFCLWSHWMAHYKTMDTMKLP